MAQINVKIDAKLKAQAEAVLNELGMTVSEAMRIFLHKVVANDGLPFTLVNRRHQNEDIPNDETVAAIEDSDSEKIALSNLWH